MAVTWEWLKQKNFRLNDTNVHPTVAQRGWDVVFEAWQQGIYVLITQSYRSISEQDALYAQGRTKPGKIVTNAKGGQSFHNFGLGLDFALYTQDGKDVSWDDSSAAWKKVVQLFKSKGFEWGGDFKSFKDTPHLQMAFGFSLAQLRAGQRPARPITAVKVPDLAPQTNQSTQQTKEDDYMISVQKADKIIGMIQAQWNEKDQQIKQYQAMWQAENAKPDKSQQKLDEYHKAADALRADQRDLADLADEIRKASGRKAVN